MNRNVKGLTLIEVMISMTMGIFFLVVAMQYLLSGQQSYQSQDTGSRIQENARFAVDLIREQVRMAGYSDVSSIRPAFIFTDACGTTAINGVSADPCARDTGSDQGDRLAIAMLSPTLEDCLGNAVSSMTTRIANVFWVEINGGLSSLYCRGWDIDAEEWLGTAQPLVDGIDQMQVQYGVFDNGSDTVTRYMNATAVEALNGWDDIRSVRVSLLVNSGVDTDLAMNDGRTLSNAVFDEQYSSFTLMDGTAFRPNDNRIRRIYSSTITINNAQ